jgi:Predicted permease.
MRVIKRSVWSVVKTAKKTILILLITSVVMTLIFTSLGIQKASVTATKQARSNVRGDVILENDFNKWSEDLDAGKENDDAKFLSRELIAKLRESEYVKAIDYELNGFLNTNFKTIMGDDAPKIEYEGDNADEFIPPTNMLNSLTEIEKNSYFSSGRLKLAEGVLPKDSDALNPVIVSQDFLKLNNLKIGQEIDVRGGLNSNRPFKATIVGTFQVNASRDKNAHTEFEEKELKDSFFATPDTVDNLYSVNIDGTRSDPYLEKILLTLTSGNDMDNFLTEFRNYEDLDTTYIQAISDKDAIDAAMSSIDNIGQISNIIVLVSSAAAVLILGLIIMLSLRERKYELGVLLSLGEKKFWLITQIVFETMVIMVVAIMVSLSLSTVVANSMQETLSPSNNYSDIGEMSEGTADEASSPIIEIPALEVNTLDPENVVFGISIGLGIVLLTSVVPTILTLRKDPKSLLLRRS